MHELANQIQIDSAQKAPHFYLHHPLLMERVYEEKVVKEEGKKKSSRQFPSRTQLKGQEVVITKAYLQEKMAKHLEQMTPEGRRQFITKTLKPIMAIHYGLTSGKLTDDQTSATGPLSESSDSSSKDEPHEINILCYMTTIFCRSMNMQSEDQLLQTQIMDTNQKALDKQQQAFTEIQNMQQTKKASKGDGTFWGIVGCAVVGVVAAVVAITVVAVVAAASIASLGTTTALMVAAIPMALVVVGAVVGVYCGFKYGGGKNDMPHGEGVDQGSLGQASTKTLQEKTLVTTFNNNIQQSTKRVDDDSNQTNQEGNYVQQAIQDLGSVMKMGN